MDLLELPIDLIWEGKIEPLSPNQLAFVNSEDIMIFDNDFSTDFIIQNHSDIIFEGEKSAEELLFELQQEIVEVDEDDDESTQWLDEPITLQGLTEYSSQQRQPLKIERTAQLLQEFNSVFDAVELTHLTPPQTPPQSPQLETFTDLNVDQFIFSSPPPPQPQQQIILNTNFFNFDQHDAVAPSPASSQDIAHEMEVVEELVRSCAENLPDWTSDDENSSQSSSPNSSPRSSSDDSFDNASQSNDDEWAPKPSTSVKRRVRSTEDKKSRKKEQNKNAATRYRQKKKAESEVVMGEERELQEKHDALQVKHADIQREIKYLKSLMRDLYRAKGLLWSVDRYKMIKIKIS